jgi:hypothetical protein
VVLIAAGLGGLVSASIWAAGYVDMRTQVFWSSFNWGVQQCPFSLIGLWFGLRVESWRGAIAMTALIPCYILAIYALDPMTGADWHSQIHHYATFIWYELCAPIMLIAATVRYRRRSTHQFTMSDMVGLTAVFALVLAFANSFASTTVMFYLARGLLIYAVTFAAGLVVLPGRISVFAGLGVLVVIILVSPLAPFLLGSHPMWIARFPLQLACLALLLIGSLGLLSWLESATQRLSSERVGIGRSFLRL